MCGHGRHHFLCNLDDDAGSSEAGEGDLSSTRLQRAWARERARLRHREVYTKKMGRLGLKVGEGQLEIGERTMWNQEGRDS